MLSQISQMSKRQATTTTNICEPAHIIINPTSAADYSYIFCTNSKSECAFVSKMKKDSYNWRMWCKPHTYNYWRFCIIIIPVRWKLSTLNLSQMRINDSSSSDLYIVHLRTYQNKSIQSDAEIIEWKPLSLSAFICNYFFQNHRHKIFNAKLCPFYSPSNK